MKKHLLFNQSFGTEGSPNQTGETQTRENRIGLMSYLRRTLMLLFAVLVMSVANIGMAWGATGTMTWTGEKLSATATASGDMAAYLTGATSFTTSGTGSKSDKSGYFGSWPNSSAGSTASDYTSQVYTTFTVTSGYTFEPTSITLIVRPNNSGSGVRGFITDGTSTIYSTAYTGNGSDYTLVFDVSGNTPMSGTIKVGIDFTNTTAGKHLWIKSGISITGTVEAAASGPTWKTITYKANGGTGDDVVCEYLTGTVVAAPNYMFSRSGYTFLGWNTKANGSGTGYQPWASISLSENIDLYAQWAAYPSASGNFCIDLYNHSASEYQNYFSQIGSSKEFRCDAALPNFNSGNNYWVGYNGSFYKDGGLGDNNKKSVNAELQYIPFYTDKRKTMGNQAQTLKGTYILWSNSSDDNLNVSYIPKNFGFCWGASGGSWDQSDFLAFHSTENAHEWMTDMISLTSTQISSWKYYVGAQKSNGDYVGLSFSDGSANLSGMNTYDRNGTGWQDIYVNSFSAGQYGAFRMWDNNYNSGVDDGNNDHHGGDNPKNLRCHFVPFYALTYDANNGSGAPAVTGVAQEGNANQRSLKISATTPTRAGYRFLGWADDSDDTEADYTAGQVITLSANKTVYAVWECVDPTITTDLSESQVDKKVGDSSPTLTVAATTAGGSVGYQWYSNTANSTSSPTPTILTGQTSASYSPSTAAAGTTYYFCKITNTTSGCSNVVYSKIAKVVVTRNTPTAYSVTGTASICSGGNTDITLSGSQTGASYQLKKDGSASGEPVDGTGSALVWNVSATGAYTVSAVQTTKYSAGDMSGTATVSLKTATSVSFSDYTLDDAIVGESYEIDGISAAGAGTLAYQWYSYSDDEGSDEDDIDGATSSTYTFTPAAAGDYYFKCKVTGECGSVTSDMITVTAAPACSTPDDPDGLAAGTITSSGVTFTITDDANTNNYEIYYSTSSTAPTGSTVAITTTTSKSKSVTGLTANTTYYAWVRAVCDESYKSDWVAGSTFKTLAAGTKYYLFTPTSAPNPSHTGTLSGAFISPSATSSSKTIDTYTFTKNIAFGGTISSISGQQAGDKNITYYNKTSSTKFTLYVDNTNGSQQILYISKIVEGETSVTVANCTIPASTAKSVEYTYETTDNTTFGFSVGNSQLVIYQIVAEEAGTAHKVAGENGYALNLNKGRVSCPLTSKADISVNGFLIKAPYNNYKFTNSSELQIEKDKESSSYIKFTTPASPGRLKLTYTGSSGVQMAYNTSASDDGATSITSATAYTLSASTTYYLVNTGTQTAKITKIEFVAPLSGYTVSIAANPAGYGTVSSSSVTSVASGTTLSASTNTLSVGATNVTASATSASAEYTYAFSNWTKSDGTALPSNVTSDLSVYANFTRTANNYTLTWNTNGGSDLDCDDCTSGSTAYGASITAPNDPTLSNYTFDGWKTNNDGTGTTAGSTMPAANTTYYAAWKQTVTLKTGAQGSGADQTPVVYLNGTSVSDFTAHTADGYTLQGYYTAGSGGTKVLNANGTFAAANVTDYITSSKWSRTGAAPMLYAQWVAAEDCSTSDFVIKKGSDTQYQGCMESTSYDGTATSFTAGSATTVGNAKMTISSYDKGAITRPGSGNTFSIVIEPVSGYYLKSICWAGKVENDETVSYYWDNNSGSATTISPQTTSGTGVTYNAPSNTTTKFTASYTDDGDGSGGIWWRNVQVEVCAGGGTTYNVTYDDNGSTGGTAPTDNTDYSYGDPVTIKDNGTLAKENYTFAGWTTNNDGTGSSYVADNTFSITANTTLYAKWTQAVTFDANTANHGSTGGSATAVWNATGLTGITHATPASGYKLLGYYTAATAGTKVLNSDGSFAATAVDGYVTDGKWSRTDAAATLYAQYESAGALTWNLIVNSDTTNLSTSTKTSAFTEISTTNMTDAALTGLKYSKGKKSSLTGKIETKASYNASEYVSVSFQVASGYKFIPSSVKVIAQPVTTGKNVKLALSDNASPSNHSLVMASDSAIGGGTKKTVTLAGDGSTYFTGTVTLKIYCYGATDAYRLGTPITIEGEVEEACATMPSFTRLSFGETSYKVGDTPDDLEVVGGTNITTYAWKQNTVNDRSGGDDADGDNDGSSYTPSTSSAGTMYYWCEMTNSTCGITIKTSAVGITVNEVKTNPTITWDTKAKYDNTDTTAYYGGKNYTLKATLNSGWNGTLTSEMFTAPTGIRLHDFTIDNENNPKTITSTFDVLTTFDVDGNDSIAFTLSLPATTTYNALSSEKKVAYNECSGAGEGSSYNLRMRKTVTKDGNYYHCANTDGWISPNISSSYSTGKAGTKMETDFDTVASSNTQYVWVRTYHANVNKVRIYADFRANDMTVSNVYKHTAYFSADSKYAVDYTAVYNGDEENENTGTAAQGYVDITLDEVMAANDILLVKFNDNKVRPLGAVITEGSAGSLNTHLQWSGLADKATVAKYTTDAYFTYSASMITENTNSLGDLTYSSSDPSVATVDATGKVALIAAGSTTIKATLAASGCYKKAEISYTLNVTEEECAIAAGTLTLTSGTESKCSSANVTLTLTGFESGADIQWKDGDTNINDGGNYTIVTDKTTRTSTLTTNQEGTYSVIVTKGCFVRSNRITISNKSTSVSAERDVKTWYIKKGRLTPPIELWSLSEGTHLSSVAWSPANATGLSGEDLFFEQDDKVYMQGTAPTADNSTGSDIAYTLTLTVKDECNNTTTLSASDKQITLYHQKNTDKHVLAFVVNGTEKGGFTEGLTAAQTTDVPLYKTIATNFDVQATNCYASDDEKKVKEYYSQYDILCITDYPNSNKTGVNKKKYVDVLGKLIDVRPILTMEAFVSDKANWKAKSISGSPKDPTTRQYTMLLQCKDHEIFSRTNLVKVGEGDETMYRVTMVEKDSDMYKTLDATYGAGAHEASKGYKYHDYPALQGFTFSDEMLEDGLLPLGLIDDGAGNDLQVGIERQAEMSARLMVLGVNSYAMERLTPDGQKVIINALNYLMKKKEEEIADCSITFIGGDETKPNDWNTEANWKGGQKPDKTTREIRILAEVIITDGQNIHAQAPIKIASGGTYNDGADEATGKITIEAGGALRVDGKITGVTAPAYSKIQATKVTDIILNTSSTAQSALIMDNEEGLTRATVKLYSLGRKDGNYQYQYFAVPMEVVPVNPAFANETHGGTGIYTYVYDEASSGWTRRKYYDDLFAFEGLGITTKSTDAMNYTMTGNLASTATKEITLTHDGAGLNLIGNSWMAPIQIGALAEDNTDANITKTVYIYCAGRDAIEGAATSGDTETAGQWIAVPFEAASFATWKEAGKLSVIPAMQAFQIKVADEATLTLDYDKVVRGSTNDLNAKLRAPGRRMAANEVTMTNIRVADSKTHTDLSLFEGDRFSEAFDNGWEAEYMNGDGRSAKLYAETEAGQMAVAAMYDYEGTVVGFAPGQETEYTFSFMGEDNGYYLNDIKLQNSVRISEGETYTFTYEEGDGANRFYISRTAINAPEVATGMENLDAAAPRVQKIIYNDKLYIIRGGRLYDATGKVVK